MHGELCWAVAAKSGICMDQFVFVQADNTDGLDYDLQIFCQANEHVMQKAGKIKSISVDDARQIYTDWTGRPTERVIVWCILTLACSLFPALTTVRLVHDLPIAEFIKQRRRHWCSRVTMLQICNNNTLKSFIVPDLIDTIEVIRCKQLGAVHGGQCKKLHIKQCNLVHAVTCKTGCIVANRCEKLVVIRTKGHVFVDFCPSLRYLPRELSLSKQCNIWVGAGCASLPAPSLDVCNIAVYWPDGAFVAAKAEHHRLFGTRCVRSLEFQIEPTPDRLIANTFAFAPATAQNRVPKLCVLASSIEHWPAYHAAVRRERQQWLADEAHFIYVVRRFSALPALPVEVLSKIYRRAFPREWDARIGWLLPRPEDKQHKNQCNLM
jgi:hypothetical protein